MAGSGRLRDADTLIRPAVIDTINALTDLTDADQAAARLAQQYASTIDDAAVIAARLAELDCGDDVALRERVARLAQQVNAQTVLTELGPRLLAVLEALGGTPRARAARKGGAPGGKGPSRLDALRQARPE